MRFVNDDVKLKHGGRKAAKITKEELLRLLRERAILVGGEEEFDEVTMEMLQEDHELMYGIVSTLVYNDESVRSGNKYNVDAENVIVPSEDFYEYLDNFDEDCSIDNHIGKHLMGFHTLENGMTFYGFQVGGDWELPVFMILYYDGKKIRSYTPTYGNCVNVDYKSAFGSEGEYIQVDESKLEKKYRKLGVWIEQDEIGMPKTSMYLAKYGLNTETLGFNWDAMKIDIESRIEVVN